MRRFLAIILACVIFGSVQAGAQLRYGAAAGMTFGEISGAKMPASTDYHLGASAQYQFPLNFSVQGSLLWQVRGLYGGCSKVGSLEIPFSAQWGPDLLAFRPYVEVTPFVGFNIWRKNMDIGAFYAGVGLGGGLEIWKLQLSCRYNWDLCPAARGTDIRLGYTTLTLAFLFDDSLWKKKK